MNRGLIARETDPSDRRRRLLALTSSGIAMVRDLTKTGAKIEARFLAALSSPDQAELRRILLALLTSSSADSD